MRLGLPPSPSLETMRKRAQAMVQALADAGAAVEPVVAESYGALGDALLQNAIDLAWAPPMVCTRVEAAGGKVALRAVRGGATSYRGALVCRAGEAFDVADAGRLVAAWVDENSAAGYLLARAWLAERGVDATRGFARAVFCGSYSTALQAVAEKTADVTSIFAAIEGAARHTTLDEVDERLRARLHVVAYTAETQTDGVVLPPGASAARLRPVLDALAALSSTPAGRAALKSVLACDALRTAAAVPTSAALSTLTGR